MLDLPDSSPFATERDKIIRRAEASRDLYRKRAEQPGVSFLRRAELRGKTIAMEQIAERLKAERAVGQTTRSI